VVLPGRNQLQELVSIGKGPDLTDIEKDVSESSGVRSLGVPATPCQSLSLDMNETSLHLSVRPERSYDPYHVGIAVYCEAERLQSVQRQSFKEFHYLRLRTLRYAVLTANDSMGLSVHQGNKAIRPMEVSPVKHEMRVTGVQGELRRRLGKAASDQTVELSTAKPALSSQLPDRVSFSDPLAEPVLLSLVPRAGIMPRE